MQGHYDHNGSLRPRAPRPDSYRDYRGYSGGASLSDLYFDVRFLKGIRRVLDGHRDLVLGTTYTDAASEGSKGDWINSLLPH